MMGDEPLEQHDELDGKAEHDPLTGEPVPPESDVQPHPLPVAEDAAQTTAQPLTADLTPTAPLGSTAEPPAGLAPVPPLPDEPDHVPIDASHQSVGDALGQERFAVGQDPDHATAREAASPELQQRAAGGCFGLLALLPLALALLIAWG